MTPANYISIGALLVSCIMAFVNIKNGKLSNKRADSAEDEQRAQRAREEQAKDTQVMLTLNNRGILHSKQSAPNAYERAEVWGKRTHDTMTYSKCRSHRT